MRFVRNGCLLAVLSSCLAWGQATSQIQGTVHDETGASVPAAEVKATQTDTGISRSVQSAADGSYVLANLPIGPYKLEVTKQGRSEERRVGKECRIRWSQD